MCVFVCVCVCVCSVSVLCVLCVCSRVSMFTYVFMTPERVCAQYVRVRTCARMHIYKHTESHKYVYASCLQEQVLHTTYHIHKNKYCILHTTFTRTRTAYYIPHSTKTPTPTPPTHAQVPTSSPPSAALVPTRRRQSNTNMEPSTAEMALVTSGW